MADSNISLRFEYIPPELLSKHWNIVKPGIEKVKEHSVDSWLVEDVYMNIKNNQATLHIAYLEDKYAGFMILTSSQSYSTPSLHIWMTYSEARDFCVFTQGIEVIKGFARNMNAERITFYSPRKGWLKHGEKLGFKPRTVQYALEV